MFPVVSIKANRPYRPVNVARVILTAALLLLAAQVGRGATDPSVRCAPWQYVPPEYVDYFYTTLTRAIRERCLVAGVTAPTAAGWYDEDCDDRVTPGADGWNTDLLVHGETDGIPFRYRDADNDGRWHPNNELLWHDADGNQVYNHGTDRVLHGMPDSAADGCWGKRHGLCYADTNGNAIWDGNEDVWNDRSGTFLTYADEPLPDYMHRQPRDWLSAWELEHPVCLGHDAAQFQTALTTLVPRFVDVADHGGDWDRAETCAPLWTEPALLAAAAGVRLTPEVLTREWFAQQARLLALLAWVRVQGAFAPATEQVWADKTYDLAAPFAWNLPWPPQTVRDDAPGTWSWSATYVKEAVLPSAGIDSILPHFDQCGIRAAFVKGYRIPLFGGLFDPAHPPPQEAAEYVSAAVLRSAQLIFRNPCERIPCRSDAYFRPQTLERHGLDPRVLVQQLDAAAWNRLETDLIGCGPANLVRLEPSQLATVSEPREPGNPYPPGMAAHELTGFAVDGTALAVVKYDGPGGFSPVPPPPVTAFPLTTPEAALNTVSDTNLDDLVEVDVDLMAFGTDTGTIVFQVERDTAQLILPLAAAPWDALPVHTYLTQGAFDGTRNRYWTDADADEQGSTLAYSLHTRARIQAVIVTAAEKRKRIEVVRPRGNVVSFAFAWDPGASRFAARGYPVGINARRSYVLVDLTPDVHRDLNFELRFESGIVHRFGGPGAEAEGHLNSVYHIVAGECGGTGVLPTTAARLPHSFQSARYDVALDWRNGRLDSVRYEARCGGGTVLTRLARDGSGVVTALAKSGPHPSLEVVGDTIRTDNGRIRTRVRIGSDVTESRQNSGGVVSCVSRLNADGLVTNRTVTVNGFSNSIRFVYQGGGGRCDNGAPVWTRLREMHLDDGYWERFEYYADTGWLWKRIMPFGNAAPTDPETLCRVEEYWYDSGLSDPQADPAQPDMVWERPRAVVTRVAGVETARRYCAYSGNTTRTRLCTEPGAAWSHPGNRESQIVRSQYNLPPNRITPTSTHTVAAEIDANGTRLRITTRDHPDQIRVRTVNAFGTEEEHEISRNGHILAAAVTSIGSFGRPLCSEYLDGTRLVRHGYTGAGPRTITEPDGVTAHLEYHTDGALKRIRRPALGRTVTLRFDALGQLRAWARIGSGGTAPAAETVEILRDAEGRIRRRTDPLGTTTWQYRNSVVTVTLPSGATRVEEYCRDRSLRAVSGSAAFPVRYQAGAGLSAVHPLAAEQRLWYSEARQAPDGAFSIRRTGFLNMAGQVSAVDSLSEAGAPVTLRYGFEPETGLLNRLCDESGLVRCFQYDAARGLGRSGCDTDGSGTLDRAGTDRITEQISTVEPVSFAGGHTQIAHLTRTSVYPDAHSATPLELQTVAVSADGREVRKTTADGRVYESVLTPLGSPGAWRLTHTDPAGGRTVLHYANRELAAVENLDAAGNRTGGAVCEYDGLGALTRVRTTRDGVTRVTEYSYDAARRLCEMAEPGKPPTRITAFRPGTDQPEAITFPNGAGLRLEYFPTGLLKRRRLVPGAAPPPGIESYDIAYTYTPQGQLATMTTTRDGIPVVTEWEYDRLTGRVVEKRIDGSTVRGFRYDAAGRLETVSGAAGWEAHCSYDPVAGDLADVQLRNGSGGAGACTLGDYDRLGRCGTMTGANGVRRTFTYTADSRVSTEAVSGPGVVPEHTLHFDYDTTGAGRTRLRVLDGTAAPLLPEILQAYDGAGRLAGLDCGDLHVDLSYAPESRLLRNLEVSRNGVPVLQRELTWDSETDRIGTVRYRSCAAGPVYAEFRCRYEPDTDRIAAVTAVDGSSRFYTYGDDGSLQYTARRTAAGTVLPGTTFAFRADSIGNLVAAGPVDAASGQPRREFQADNFNLHTARVWGSTVEIAGTAATDATVTAEYGQQIAAAARSDGGHFAVRVKVDNDSGPRLCPVTIRAVRFDGTVDLVAAESLEVLVPPSRETLSVDAQGNRAADALFDYEFDAWNRLQSAASRPDVPEPARVRLEFEYYPDGRRAAKRVLHRQNGSWVLKTTHEFVYDGWRPLLEIVRDANGMISQRAYLWGPDLDGQQRGRPADDSAAAGIGGLIAITSTRNGSTRVYLPILDQAGTVHQLVDADSGQVVARYFYDPAGTVLGAVGPARDECPFRFATRYWDPETRLYCYGYRYCDPASGKWLSRDPLGERGGTNLYAFVNNDPVNLVDPLGLALYAFDGTWCHAGQRDPLSGKSLVSNVRKFHLAHTGLGHYIPGVGNAQECGPAMRILGGATGLGARDKLDQMWQLLESRFRRGDRVVDIVGFSRGAAMALEFANMIKKRKPEARIRFLGLWDTVGAFGIANNPLQLPRDNIYRLTHSRILSILGSGSVLTFVPDSVVQQTNLGYSLTVPGNVDYAVHALALDETRDAFRVTRLVGAREVWFSGGHGNVGGGGSDSGLSDITLLWMIKHAEKCGLQFDQSRLADLNPNSRGAITVKESLQYGIRRRRVWRNEMVHESVRAGRWRHPVLLGIPIRYVP